MTNCHREEQDRDIPHADACCYENIETDEYCLWIRLASGFNISRK